MSTSFCQFFDSFYLNRPIKRWELSRAEILNFSICKRLKGAGSCHFNVSYQKLSKMSKSCMCCCFVCGNGKAGSTVTIVTIQAVKSGKDQIYLARQVCKVCTYFEFVSPFVVTAIGVKIKQQAISSFEVYALQEKDSSASEEMLRCLAFLIRGMFISVLMYLWPLFSVNLLIKTFFGSI